jgi:hypothetical protein
MNSVYLLTRIVFVFSLLALVATAAANTNVVQVFVHPGSGTICVDSTCQVDVGSLSGYSSSQFANIAGGRDHTIKVYDTDGYQDYTDQFYMDYNGDDVTLQVYLVPLATGTPAPVTTSSGTGTVRVYVSPGLGQVCIDNRECDTSTGAPSSTWNVDFVDVMAGTPHTITVTADGYQTTTTQVTVLPDQVNEAEVTLQPLPTAAETESTTPAPQTTRAGLGGVVAVVAVGICGILVVDRKRGV